MSKIVILAATGCGISAIKAIGEELIQRRNIKKIYLFWGLRKKSDICLKSIFDNWALKNNKFRYQIVLSQPDKTWVGAMGHINNHLLNLSAKLSKKETSFYLCGNKEMVDSLNNSLPSLGFPQKNIHFENYF